MRNRVLSEAIYKWHNKDIIPFDYKPLKTPAERELELVGILIYKCEGSKAHGCLDVTSADETIILQYLRYLREICRVYEPKISLRLHIHDSMEPERAIEYWSAITGVPKERFGKTYVKPDLGKKRKYPFGTCCVRFSDMKLQEIILAKLAGLGL